MSDPLKDRVVENATQLTANKQYVSPLPYVGSKSTLTCGNTCL